MDLLVSFQLNVLLKKATQAGLGKFEEADINQLRYNPDVEYIEEDGVMSTSSDVIQCDISTTYLNDYLEPLHRQNAPWGISRMSRNSAVDSYVDDPLSYTYHYDSSAGAGVDIYIIGV